MRKFRVWSEEEVRVTKISDGAGPRGSAVSPRERVDVIDKRKLEDKLIDRRNKDG